MNKEAKASPEDTRKVNKREIVEKPENIIILESLQVDNPTKMNSDEIEHHMWYFGKQAKILGLSERFEKIHRSISVEQLEEFSKEELFIYCSLMGIDTQHLNDEDLLRIFIRNEKIRWIEMKKYYIHIEDVLFSGLDEKPKFASYTLENYAFPETGEILNNGAKYYFFTFGELTPDSIVDRYERQQILMILTHLLLHSNTDFVLKEVSNRFLASEIMRICEEIFIDVRLIVGMMKVYKIHNMERDETDFVINGDREIKYDLPGALKDQGYNVSDGEPVIEMFTEYCVQSFQPSFVSQLDYHRKFSENKGDVFYGMRTGQGDYECYVLKDLIKSFKESGDFVKPNSIEEKFSLYSINRLKNLILPRMKNSDADELTDVINKMKVIREPISYSDNDGKATASLFNLSFILKDWENFVTPKHYDSSYKSFDTLCLGPEATGDAMFGLMKVLKIAIAKIKEVPDMGDNKILKFYKGQVIMTDHSILDYLHSITYMNFHKIYSCMETLGHHLFFTISYYDKLFRGGDFAENVFKIDI